MADFTVIVTALDETWSLRDTVDTLLDENADDIAQVIVAIAPHTTPETRVVLAELEQKYPEIVRRHEQSRLPGVGGAVRECAGLADTGWTIIMSSDLETPPESVKDMIERARRDDVDVVATSRWQDGGGFKDYQPVKLVCNWIFQKLFRFLYGSSLTDLTYGFRAYRTWLLRGYQWRETGHAFFLESICRLLRSKRNVAEIPVNWVQRQEGRSHIKLAEFARYFRIGLVVRFSASQQPDEERTEP